MDGVSAAASIVGIATTGIQVSIKVITLAGQISTAAGRIRSIGNDVSLTSAILHQLGDLMSQNNTDSGLPTFNQAGLEATKSSAEICHNIFKEVERETAKASIVVRGRKRLIGEKVKLTPVEKMKWPFLQPEIEILREDLREANGTLMLMLQLANLALSKRVADLNSFTPSGTTEQRDIIRSVLVLKRQQEKDVDPKTDSDTELFEDREKRHPRTAQDAEDSSSQRPTSASQHKAKAGQLRWFTLDPFITFKHGLVKIQWNEADCTIPESEMRELISKDKADDFKPVFNALEALSRFERTWIVDFVGSLGHRVTLVYLKRTEQDLQDHGIIFKCVPSFQLITEAPIYESDYLEENLTRPTYIKVHVKHICPETLDAYNLPWRWDHRDSNYIIITQWINETDQLILFDHTRSLRQRTHMTDSIDQFRREKNKLMRGRKKSPTERPADRPCSIDSESAGDGLCQENVDGESDDEYSDPAAEDESEENAAVDELLRKYTTFFDGADKAKRKNSSLE